MPDQFRESFCFRSGLAGGVVCIGGLMFGLVVTGNCVIIADRLGGEGVIVIILWRELLITREGDMSTA